MSASTPRRSCATRLLELCRKEPVVGPGNYLDRDRRPAIIESGDRELPSRLARRAARATSACRPRQHLSVADAPPVFLPPEYILVNGGPARAVGHDRQPQNGLREGS